MTRRAAGLWCLAVFALLLVPAGCSEKRLGKPEETFHKPVLEKLAKAKLKVGDFQAVAKPEVYGAPACQEGRVAELAVLLCRYESPEKAASEAPKRLAFVGQAVTGAERLDGRLALVVADPDKKDLRGIAMQTLLQAFRSEKPF